MSQEANKLQMSFLANSIYSREPISKTPINDKQLRDSNKQLQALLKPCAQWRFYEIKVPIPCNHVYFCSVLKTPGHVGASNSLCFISHYNKGFRTFFPKLMWQFRLLIFSFSKSLDGCAMTWVSQPALSCDQLALWVFLVDKLFPPELHTPYPPETPMRAGKNVL